MAVTIDEVYDYIKKGNVVKVQEYLDSIATSGSVFLSKVNNFLNVAVNFKQLKIVQLLIAYGADPKSLSNITMFYAFCKEDLDLYNYLLNGRTFQEYLIETNQYNGNPSTPGFNPEADVLFPKVDVPIGSNENSKC